MKRLIALIPLLVFAGDFWNEKKPADWTPEEKHQLLTQSPWAKQIAADIVDASTRNNRFRNRIALGGYGNVTSAPPMSQMERPMTIRWASAAPMLAITAENTPRKSKEFYMISISGMPVELQTSSGNEMKERLMDSALIRVKGHDPLRPDDAVIETDVSGKTPQTILYFFFSRDYEIKLSDKEVSFEFKMGPMQTEAKFFPKEMTVNGKLVL